MSRIIPLATAATLVLLAASSLIDCVIAQEARIISSCIVPNTIALTFDNGPWIYMTDIVEKLTSAGAQGTFFVDGNNYDCIYAPASLQRLKNAMDNGHQIASTSWNHTDLTTLNSNQIRNEMLRVEQAIQNITGAQSAFIRPPYGSYDSHVLQAAYSVGSSIVLWDFDAGDQEGSSPEQSKASFDKLLSQKPSTALVRMAQTMNTTAHQVLPYVIKQAKDAGYRLVTLAECVGMPPYQSVGAPATPDPSWRS